ncbi:MAG: metallophosphoesterase [Thermodesulfobacteriota bacterium]
MHRKPNLSSKRLPAAVTAVLLLATVLGGLIGCSGGSDSASFNQPAGAQANVLGSLLVGLTDAEGDFTSYAVDVVSLTLTRQDGAKVSVLPLQTRVDFAQYTDMTEFLTAASVGPGLYVAAELTLDYTGADIWAEGPDGQSQQVTRVLDTEGSPVTQLTLTVDLVDRKALVIAPGIPATLTLDFDLASTNRVDFGPPVTCYVSPVLSASVIVEKPKLHRVRGPLVSVNPESGSFLLAIRPFVHALKGQGPDFGKFTVRTGPGTVFVIDDISYQGEDGVAALAQKPAGTAVVALGDLLGGPVRFLAREVRAGSTVPGGDKDAITGNVTARAGNVLTVQGASMVRKDGSVAFLQNVAVTVSDSTAVSKALSPDPASIADISVGQRISVFGTMQEGEMDASAGHAHLMVTSVFGTAAGSGWPLVLSLGSIDLRPASAYTFAGTGTSPENDADPDNYEIATGGMDVSGIPEDAPVKVLGFPAPFGTAPLDFTALSVTDLSLVRASLTISWPPKAESFLEELGPDGLVPNLSTAGFFHHLIRGGVAKPVPPEGAPRIVPAEKGIYILRGPGFRLVFLDFGEMTAGLADRLDSGARIRALSASGGYSPGENTLEADSLVITFG